MQEIAPNIRIENSFSGVTLGSITWPHIQVMIDTPFQQEDLRVWKNTLHSLQRSGEKLLICLDDHLDRTIGARAFECMLIGHEKLAQQFKDRPVTLKPQGIETGSEWEACGVTGPSRWTTPEITFSDHLELHWEDHTLLLDHRPGSSVSALWATLPAEKVIFIGDLVIKNAPPFLATADIPAWIANLDGLLKPEFKHSILVSGRDGVISHSDIKNQIKLLERIEKQLEKLSDRSIQVDEVHKASQGILKHIDHERAREQLYLNRLRWGIQQYLRRQLGIALELGE